MLAIPLLQLLFGYFRTCKKVMAVSHGASSRQISKKKILPVWVVKSIEFKFWWLSHRSVGLNPGGDTCVLEQDSLLCLLLYTYGYKWVPARVQVDIVNEKAFRACNSLGCILPNEPRKIKGILSRQFVWKALYKNLLLLVVQSFMYNNWLFRISFWEGSLQW